jgi:hypothetical protein
MSSEVGAASTRESILSSEYSSFGHALLRFVKSIHTLHLSLDLLTMTILASHPRYAISHITLEMSNLLASAFAPLALSLDILRSFCFRSLLLGSTFRACSMILLSTPHESFADQTKTFLL